jgi:hypothetical protein
MTMALVSLTIGALSGRHETHDGGQAAGISELQGIARCLTHGLPIILLRSKRYEQSDPVLDRAVQFREQDDAPASCDTPLILLSEAHAEWSPENLR